ncbi:hypothetical protein FRX31_024057 [Thalictrum thalictroides]|uniref:Uncharacterized protein n=1 Tax=Thalictrum thalictroides TaxID=46969 RepID=A0A7J6VMM1_THATH|nr:hypothetical protein FRX31_024057 [Thalictrum thalictroides]
MLDYYRSNSDKCCQNNGNASGGEDSSHWLIDISKPDSSSDEVGGCEKAQSWYHPNVLKVLQDTSIHIKDKDCGILCRIWKINDV